MSNLFVLPSDNSNWQQYNKYANFLLKEGATVLWATQPFRGVTSSASEMSLDRGTFLITYMPSHTTGLIHKAERRFDVAPITLDSVHGFVGLTLKPIRIAMYGGGGAPFNHARIFAELGFFVDFISPQEVKQGKLAEFDLFGMPGGGGIAMKGQLDPLGELGCQKIAEFVQAGGMYIGSCAGSFDAAIVSDSFLSVCPQQRNMQLVNSMVWNRNDTEWVGLNSPGVGVLESRNVRPDHPVMFGIPDRFQITHYNGPFFELQPGTLSDASDSIGLSSVEDFTEDYTPSEYFLRFSNYDAEKAQNSTLITKAAREGRFNIISGFNRLGRVVLFGSHPEFGYNLAMDKWDIPARMLANAALWQAGHLQESRSMLRKSVSGVSRSFPIGDGLKSVARYSDNIIDSVNQLRQLDVRHLPWLADQHAMSTFGLSGYEIWEQNLDSFDDISSGMKQTLSQTQAVVSQASSLISSLESSTSEPNMKHHVDLLHDAILGMEEAIHYQTPVEWNQDFGYEGILQMLERTQLMLNTAINNINESFEPSTNPYAHFDSSPYQLVVGSYLAAIGVYANSWFLLQVHLLRIEERVFAIQSMLETA